MRDSRVVIKPNGKFKTRSYCELIKLKEATVDKAQWESKYTDFITIVVTKGIVKNCNNWNPSYIVVGQQVRIQKDAFEEVYQSEPLEFLEF